MPRALATFETPRKWLITWVLVIGDSSSLAPIQACLQLQSKHAWQATL
nr:MAG TPA: hypothetical protein [Caudoviricetes sp.]